MRRTHPEPPHATLPARAAPSGRSGPTADAPTAPAFRSASGTPHMDRPMSDPGLPASPPQGRRPPERPRSGRRADRSARADRRADAARNGERVRADPRRSGRHADPGGAFRGRGTARVSARAAGARQASFGTTAPGRAAAPALGDVRLRRGGRARVCPDRFGVDGRITAPPDRTLRRIGAPRPSPAADLRCCRGGAFCRGGREGTGVRHRGPGGPSVGRRRRNAVGERPVRLRGRPRRSRNGAAHR